MGLSPSSSCANLLEPENSPNNWNDNYFCLILGPVPHLIFSSVNPATTNCVKLLENTPSWNDNWICSPNHNLGAWRWSYDGRITSMPKYVQISESNDSFWDNNYLNFPASELMEYKYSSNGPLADSWNTQLLEPTRISNGWDNNYFGVKLVTTQARISPSRTHDVGYPASTLPSLVKFTTLAGTFSNGDVIVVVQQRLEYGGTNNIYNHNNWIMWKSSLGFSTKFTNNLGKFNLCSFRQNPYLLSALQTVTITHLNSGTVVTISGATSNEAASAVEFMGRLIIFWKTIQSGLSYSLYEGGTTTSTTVAVNIDADTLSSAPSCVIHFSKEASQDKIYCFYLAQSNMLKYVTLDSNLIPQSAAFVSGATDAKEFNPSAVDVNGQLWVLTSRSSDHALTANVLDGPYP